MEWISITTEDVLAHMPTDVLAQYTAWIGQYPDRAGRLAEITANTIREFRDAIKSVPANTWPEDETKLPQSAVRHCENIIVFSLCMEMGIAIDTAGTSAVTNANIYLRQIPYGRLRTVDENTDGEGTPSYSVPEPRTGRALPAYLLAFLLLASRALGGWIDPGSVLYDTSIHTTFVPSAYSITASTLYGQLYGIDAKLATTIATETRTNISLTGNFTIQPYDDIDIPDLGDNGTLWQSHELIFVTRFQGSQAVSTTNILRAGDTASDSMGAGTTRSNLYWNGARVLVEGDGTAETDPVWQAEKSNYATGTPIYVETDSAVQSLVSISDNRISSRGGNGDALTISGEDGNGPPPGGTLNLFGGDNGADGEGGEIRIEAGIGYNGEKRIYMDSDVELGSNHLKSVASITLGTNPPISNWPSASGITEAQAGQIATNVVGHGLSDYYVVAYAPSIALNPTNGYRQGLYLAGTSIVSIAGGATNQMGSVRLDAWTGTNQHLFTNPVPAGTWSTSAVNTVIYSKPSHSAAWTARVFQW